MRYAITFPEDRDAVKFKSVFASVEADSYARNSLWQHFSPEGIRMCKSCPCDLVQKWEDETSGFMFVVGTNEDGTRPVTVEFSFATINHRLVLFWNSPSRFVDHDQIDAWFAKYLPEGIRQNDATNFANTLHDINQANTPEWIAA